MSLCPPPPPVLSQFTSAYRFIFVLEGKGLQSSLNITVTTIYLFLSCRVVVLSQPVLSMRLCCCCSFNSPLAINSTFLSCNFHWTLFNFVLLSESLNYVAWWWCLKRHGNNNKPTSGSGAQRRVSIYCKDDASGTDLEQYWILIKQ